jgi:superoxide dismutase, Fe-Mn family
VNPLSTFTATLRYGFSALEPALSRETVRYHFIQHHRHCYERTAALVKGTTLESLSLQSLLRAAGKEARYGRLFMLASEAWNHDLYWRSLRPGGGGTAWGPVAQGIEHCFGSFATFVREAKGAASAVIGSAWLWVTWRAGRIELVTTGPMDSPLLHGHVPLLAIDLWEHAYYLDYYNARIAYVQACLMHLTDWGAANERLRAATDKRLEQRRAVMWLAWGAPQAAAQTPGDSCEKALHVASPPHAAVDTVN